MSKGSKRRPENKNAFDDSFDRIFGSGMPKRGSYVQDPDTGKLVPKSEYVPKEVKRREWAAIHGPIEPFVSPVDGTVISDRKQLREHNKRHGVTNTADYGPEWFKRKAEERNAHILGKSKEAKAARVEAIQKVLYEKGLLR